MSDEWNAFLKRAQAAFTGLIEEASVIGYEAGRAEGAKNLREQVVKALEFGARSASDNIQAVLRVSANQDASQGRAAPGSVKPVVLKVVSEHPEGLTTEEVRKLTGLKANSVRGTLWTLNAEEKVVDRREGKWFPMATRPEPRVRSRPISAARAPKALAGTSPDEMRAAGIIPPQAHVVGEEPH